MEEGRNTRLIVGVSGGKDSTATCLHLIHNLNYKIEDFDRVFLDTGWENKQTYDYLDYIEKTIGPIIRLKQKVEIKKHKNHVDYFEKKLGHRFFMEEALHIIHLSFRYHDVTLFSS